MNSGAPLWDSVSQPCAYCKSALGFSFPMASVGVSPDGAPYVPKSDQRKYGVHVADYAIPERQRL
jgi:alpha-acetolactate decarboxylase